MTGGQAAMVTALASDLTLMGLLTGGLHTDPLTVDTAGAWETDGLTGAQSLNPCAVLLWPQDVPEVSGYQTRDSFAYEAWPDLTFYAEPADVSVIESAEELAIARLFNTVIDGYSIRATATRLAQMTADELPGHIQTFARRFRVTALRHAAAV